jgi:hypothetical protein
MLCDRTDFYALSCVPVDTLELSVFADNGNIACKLEGISSWLI